MKLLKKTSFAIIAVVLVALSAVTAFSETIYSYYGIEYVIVTDSEISVVGWDNRSPNLVIPADINGRKIASVNNGALEANTVITSVDFSDAVDLSVIGSYAFQNCTGINEQLVLTESITEIQNRAFQGCSSLPSVIIKSGISEISTQCFNECSSLASAELCEGIEKINAWAFANCSSLEYVNVPQSVTFISDYAFFNDDNLTLGVWYDSYGYQYAQEKDIPYILLDGVKLGDVNSDGEITISDVTDIQRYLAELIILNDNQLAAADTNRDGTVDISDATALQMYLADYNIPYPIGEYITI